MMDEQKQIEEMAQVIMQPQSCKGYEDNRGCYFGHGKGCEDCKIERHENAQIMADYLYNAGYRKIPENAVVLTREEYDKIYEQAEATVLSNIADGGTSCHWCMDKHEKIGYEKGCKETAEKFAERLKEKLEENSPVAGYDLEDLEFDGVTIQECIDEIAKEFTEGKK